MKRIIASFCSLLLYPILYYPYKLIDEKYIVEKFGCSCPLWDPETGEVYARSFNANDFTLLVWSVIAVIATVISAIIARKCEKKWQRFAIPAAVFVISCLLTRWVWRSLFWA